MKRREFIKSLFSSATFLSAATGVSPALGKKNKATISNYYQLGNTDIKMSDVSFGCATLPSASLALRAIDRGINFFDTAPLYGRSEEILGEAIEKYGQRDKIYISSKFGFYSHLLPWLHFKPYSGAIRYNSPKSHYITAVEDTLKRLRTDYLDIVFIHGVGSSYGGIPGEEASGYEIQHQRMFGEEVIEAAKELKKAGKIRYLGVSSHGPNDMERHLIEAVQSEHFDVILMAYNFLRHHDLSALIEEIKKSDVGVIAMKTLAGSSEGQAVAEPGEFERAALKYTLNQNFIDAAIVSITKVGHLDQYLGASGQPFEKPDQLLLDRHASVFGSDYCRTGCNTCEPSCPGSVQIADIMRQHMYFSSYGREKEAMEGYARIEQNATACLTCYDTPCALGCPHKLNIPEKMQAAHHNLVLT